MTKSYADTDDMTSRLLESYRELQNPLSIKIMEKSRSSSVVKNAAPTTFPESYPFSMISVLPDSHSGTKDASRAGSTYIPALGETAAVLLVIILTSPNKHILGFFQLSLEIEGRDRLVALLSQFFKVAISILEGRAFPKMWLNINILAHKVLIKMMEPISSLLETEFIPPPEDESPFNAQIWKEAFYMLLKLLSSEQLVIEEFSPQVCVGFLECYVEKAHSTATETTSCVAFSGGCSWRGCCHSLESLAGVGRVGESIP